MTMGMLLSVSAYALDIPLTVPLPPTVQSVELSYVEGQTIPTVTLRGQPESPPIISYRPHGPTLDLLATMESFQVFGSCRGRLNRSAGEDQVTVTFTELVNGRCGMKINLRPSGGTLDILSYATVRLRGQATGRLTIALEDRSAALREDNSPVATVQGPFDLNLPLSALGRSLDLRQVTAIVLTTEESGTGVLLEQFHLLHRAVPMVRRAATGLWIWRWQEALADPAGVWSTCRRLGCSRVLIQMPASSDDEATWTAYGQFMAQAREQGIDAVALDGYPEAVSEPRTLADKIHRLLVRVAPRTLAGVQLDIEPYLHPGFFADESGARRYLEAIDLIKEVIGDRTPLSVVIPFWFTSATVGGRPLAFSVMDRADEVAVMSYRTSLDEVKDISEDTLRYGDLIGIPVWLALETTRLPVEHRVIMKPAAHGYLVDAVLDRTHARLLIAPFSPPLTMDEFHEGFRIHSRYTVEPERVTFAGHSRAEVITAATRLVDSMSHASFAGVLIHDFHGFLALSE